MISFFKNLASRHSHMDRFVWSFIVIMAMFVGITGWSLYCNIKDLNKTLSESAIYTKQGSFSKSENAYTIEHVYTSSDKKKTFVVLKFKDISTVSTNASDYHLYITARNADNQRTSLSGTPSASFYMFGNTGYAGIYIVNEQGFSNQIYDVVLRSNSALVGDEAEYRGSEKDVSFQKYDQTRILFNPAGASAESLDVLDATSDPTADKLYRRAIISSMESKAHEKLSEDLDKLKSDLDLIDEYRARLVTDNIKVPDLPDDIKGDRVEGEGEDKRLITNTVPTNGWHLDWQHTSILDKGFLDDLIAKSDDPTQSIDKYLTIHSTLGTSTSANIVNQYKWTLEDGTEISKMSSSASQDRSTQLQNDISDYTSAVSTYINDKCTYLTSDMSQLINAEVLMRANENKASVIAGEGAYSLY